MIEQNDLISRSSILEYLEEEIQKLRKSDRLPFEWKEISILTIKATIKFIKRMDGV